MPYQISYYYVNGNLNNCNVINAWRCCGGGDFNDPIRNQVTAAYFSAFGRYGEQSGVESWVNIWVFGNGKEVYNSIYDMVFQNAAGADIAARSGARHVWGGAGGCPVRGCTDPQASNFNSNADIDDGSCIYAPPSVSISVSPSSIIRGNNATLSWSASGVISSVSVTDVSSPGTSGSRSVSPNDDRTYFITASGVGGSSTASTTLVVYIPPVITLSLNKTSIIAGQCATLSWSTTGDANNIQWISGSINNFNLTSSATVCPTDTTIYTARVSGLGGQDTDTITLIVNQIPSLSVTTPETLDYGVDSSFSYVSQYADISLNVKIYYRYQSENPVLVSDTNLPKASSSQLSAPDSQTKASGNIQLDIEYNDFGPRYIDIIMTATGNGGTVTVSREIAINIDETPDNIVIPEKDDAIKSEDPVFAPETEVLSDLLLVTNIDIPVEIKANAPVQVDINKQGNWNNVRQK
jgi:hypothetical protein